ncbi:uncharacterized protein LOC142050520 [Phalacrocorax aristotelis]|uniref:uncharacterized protein LOC142050520 n=1 Tax=Phalacrocorax aristotelis TaxID=126867 RepID=UPI003F4B59A4
MGDKLPPPPGWFRRRRRKSPRLLPPSAPAQPQQRGGRQCSARRRRPAASLRPLAVRGVEPARNSTAAVRDDPQRAHRRRRQPPVIVAVSPPPGGRAGEGGPRRYRPGPCGLSPPRAGAARRARSHPRPASPSLCDPLGTGASAPFAFAVCDASAPARAPSRAQCGGTVLPAGAAAGGAGQGGDRLDGRAIAGAAFGAGGARTLRSGGPGDGGAAPPDRDGCGRGQRRFLRRRRAVRGIRTEPALTARVPQTRERPQLGRRQRGTVHTGRPWCGGKPRLTVPCCVWERFPQITPLPALPPCATLFSPSCNLVEVFT